MYSNSVIIHREKVLYVSNESCLQSRSVPLSTSPSTLNTFLSSNFPDAQFPKRQLTKYVLATALGIPTQPLAPQKVTAWEVEHFRSCYLEKCHLKSRPWENAYVMVPTIFEKLASEIWLQSCKVTSKLKT